MVIIEQTVFYTGIQRQTHFTGSLKQICIRSVACPFQPTFSMKGKQVSLPNRVVTLEAPIFLEKLLNGFKWPGPMFRRDRVPIDVGVLNDEIGANPHELAKDAQLVGDVFLRMIGIKYHHSC